MTAPRHYPLARALLAQEQPTHKDPHAVRIRRSPVPTAAAETPLIKADTLLQSMADSAVMWTGELGKPTDSAKGVPTHMAVSINNALLGELSCTLTLFEGRIEATFFAPDKHTRNLLMAEAGRLRAQLATKGLTVSEVHVASQPIFAG